LIFLPTFVVLLRFAGFERVDRRTSPAKVFICLLVALLVVGAVEWLATQFPACGIQLTPAELV
jgi:hypothetical protein